MHTATKDNVIMDIVNGSKFIFVLEEVRKLSNLENVSFLDIHKISQATFRVDHNRMNNNSLDNNELDVNELDYNEVNTGLDNNGVDANELDVNRLDNNNLDNNGINNEVNYGVCYRIDINRRDNDANRSMDNNFQFKPALNKNNTRPFTHDINPTLNCKSRLKIYSDTEYGKNYLLESIHTRLRHQELLCFIQNYEFTKIEISKSIKRSFCGDTGGVFIEFRTLEPDDFRLILLEQSKKVFLDIHKIITTRPFVLVLPISNFTLKLYPKYKINNFLELKMVNLPYKYANESLINCDIGLNRNQKFLFPFLVSDNRNDLIIYWEKQESVSGYLRNKETTVEIKGNGNIRADEGEYSIVYKNNGKKKRNIKIFMGCTRKGM
ncbi:hypothetical protein NBO_52g0016 [Nosema bombycis CQ1]|uniref:Uncharacterized protein n=1 Tax=Nosema bombycis (strain CQ1 / CVCC 102059) TaxID=578461 RepID=R0MIF7_NOSB1|nr:hypothetical protein NBO_52g0016 [Nosema bombycis CQ1]|eukprot:EOB13925.1 hypothetical protein NBO_52g0016 [Nosema bombycis CQ1]